MPFKMPCKRLPVQNFGCFPVSFSRRTRFSEQFRSERTPQCRKRGSADDKVKIHTGSIWLRCEHSVVNTTYFRVWYTSFGKCVGFVWQNKVQKRVFHKKLVLELVHWGVSRCLEEICCACRLWLFNDLILQNIGSVGTKLGEHALKSTKNPRYLMIQDLFWL